LRTCPKISSRERSCSADDATTLEHRCTLRIGQLEPGFEPDEQFFLAAGRETSSCERHLQQAHV
jgi:hypothetical protein